MAEHPRPGAPLATADAPALHVFFDDYEWWVGVSAEDARGQQIATCFGGKEDEALPVEEWEQVADDKLLTMHMEDPERTAEKSAAEWAIENGRGFLGSTDW